ncbi:MAG TPA: Gfo/Idh/MocA family oxidoreductase [Bacillota bacterium]|nr:Gfo/Idh/MocA family oxidoreductase [Clostridiales bacterium]HPT84953.1 Gfo/Idh/MocA family oxidoreductase [Bacillota bacterium]
MAKAPLKVGVVGMGGIGNLHADCHKADELAELVAVCDLIKERADKAAERLGVPAYYSLKDMLKAHPELDIVDVCTSGYENGSWHYEPTMEALDAGKHVLVEKPISNDINEAREMVAYAQKRGLYLGCNLNHYFSIPAERAKKYIDEGQVGEQVYCINKVGFNGSETGYGGPGAPRWNRPYSHAKAFLTHPFSVMRYFCGDVTHVQAFMDKPGVRRRASDLMLSIQSIHMRFENGCVGYLLSQRGDAMFGLGGWWSFELAGTKGTFVIENCVEKLTYYKSGAEPEVLNTGITDFNSTFPRRIHAFLEDVSNGVPLDNLRASGRDALATMEYIFAAIESYENGGELVRPHPLPPLHGAVGTI